VVKELRTKLVNMYLSGEGTQQEFEDTLALLAGLLLLDTMVGAERRASS
jgi:hypothetical protein